MKDTKDEDVSNDVHTVSLLSFCYCVTFFFRLHVHV